MKMADPNQTPSRGEWVCPCSGCQKSVASERKQLIDLFEKTKHDYLVYRGSSFDDDGNLFWAKDDAAAFAKGIDAVIELIKERMPKPKIKQQ
jgi:hypothetical protein